MRYPTSLTSRMLRQARMETIFPSFGLEGKRSTSYNLELDINKRSTRFEYGYHSKSNWAFGTGLTEVRKDIPCEDIHPDRSSQVVITLPDRRAPQITATHITHATPTLRRYLTQDLQEVTKDQCTAQWKRSSGNGDGNGRHSLQRSKMPYYADCHGDWAGDMLSLSVGLWNRDGDEDGEMP
ncbi:uncharacterized protein K444DRAFT_625623 [Hyaloscypha bicolor E]|uniref:Uncharacterized protein n=1 Tax=Hyaloscypha bicolor E TaxID=1095630 RepID=A0A2J6TPZ2_9HELO|nr:uncharacterized protein K444DRAFT_625623 [Hyaloscypha bicolor E]PMD65008.1 hypothetical protein K444DRAFT_625623 [Hyaloscypha bicolor E]